MRRAARLALALLALGALWWVVSEPGPRHAPWTDPPPANAVRDGYTLFRWRQGGRAVPGWADAWLARFPPDPAGPLLIDRRHTSKQPETSALGLTTTRYDEMHGYARAFGALEAAGVETRSVWEPFTPQRLAGASAVFINLPSGDNPGFWWSEVQALEAFVRRGGGLFLITDHTNCYFHAELLQPLTDALGVELLPVTAADRAPERTLSPRTVAWLRVLPTAAHPVTEGVGAFGFMTGGAARLRAGARGTVLAATSAEGWADRWDPYLKDDSSGFTGNLQQEPEELPGPVPVALAVEHGAGRVLVFADQNAFGATLVGFEDTERLFANGMSWVLQRPVVTPGRGPATVTTLAGERYLCTAAAPFGYRTLQVQASRLAAYTGVPEFCTAWAPTASRRLLVLPEAARPDLPALLTQAERVVVLLDPLGPATPLALDALGLRLGSGPGEAAEGLRWLAALPAPPHPVLRGAPALEPLRPRPLTVLGEGLETLAEDSLGRPVLLRLQRGQTELLLVLDADLLRNEGMGKERDRPGAEPARAASHRLAWRLLGWLWEGAGG